MAQYESGLKGDALWRKSYLLPQWRHCGKVEFVQDSLLSNMNLV